MNLFLIKILTLKKLGLLNAIHVLNYRIKIKFGISSACKKKKKLNSSSAYFNYPESKSNLIPNNKWNSGIRLFDYHSIKNNFDPPNWFLNYKNKKLHPAFNLQWWKINDFDENIGDIKLIWELSRMDWLIPFSQMGVLGDLRHIDKLNSWLKDWVENNQPYIGPNWKCGQEASIRVINLALTCYILDQKNTSTLQLCRLIELHLERIKPTIKYALAQNNNHGTSEAAALFIGGSWLSNMGITSGKVYTNLGRKLLEGRVKKLIDEKGTFSQYSANYHRLMLDTLSFTEIWRMYICEKSFSKSFYLKAKLATKWLNIIIFNSNGCTPNLGANDGAKLLQINNSSYVDYRPSVNLASNLFNRESSFIDENSINHLKWLRVDEKKYHETKIKNEKSYDLNGFFILKNQNINLLLRYPYFNFRPSQSDLMHLDLWFKGDNLLTDSGTYSYNSDRHHYYTGASCHNTIAFDDRNHMPQLSRFLYGMWPKKSKIVIENFNDEDFYSSAYSDYKGCTHKRSFNISNFSLHVIDQIKGFNDKAVLRWHFNEGEQAVTIKEISNGIMLSDRNFNLELTTDSKIARYALKETKKSLYYFEEHSSKVLEIEVNDSSTIHSLFTFF